jgi:hypothetical protein
MSSPLPFRVGPMLHRLLMFVIALAMMGLPLHVLPERAAHAQSAAGAPQAGDESTPARALTVEENLVAHYEAFGGDDHQRVRTMKVSGTAVPPMSSSPPGRRVACRRTTSTSRPSTSRASHRTRATP